MKVLYNATKKYVLIAIAFALVFLFSSHLYDPITEYVGHFGEEGHKFFIFITVIMLFSIGIFVYYLAKSTVLPSFVLAILFGFAAQNFLEPILENEFTVNVLVTLGAIFILFGGGLDTPFKHFKQLFKYIFSLAFVGTLITAFALSVAIALLGKWFGFELSTAAIVLLGAAMASTDPAAIIPSLNRLVFKKSAAKYIAISESALNDVVGAILTITFLTVFQNIGGIETIAAAYAHLVTAETVLELTQIIGVGVLVGGLGYLVLEFWHKFKQKTKTEEEADSAFFMAMPLFIYTFSQLFAGSGFLAAFLSPLIFQLSEHIKHVEHYFQNTVEAFMKPMIFIILGAMIDFPELVEYAPVGIGVALVFMFIIRPIVVFLTAGPFLFFSSDLSVKELLFLSFIRETGVIPAVLLVTLASSGLPGAEAIVPIGMWVILLTLIIQPPLTPWVAQLLGIAEPMAETTSVQIAGGTEPAVVLVSRGDSYIQRLPFVVDWAAKHNIFNIALLHSPEDNYSPEFIEEHQATAEKIFSQVNAERAKANEKKITFEFIAEKGYLQDNIRRYVETHSNISIVFAGKKMLDFRSKDIKNLSVPFFFID